MKRFFAWVGILVLAVAAGFGLGALIYKPPTPELGSGQIPTAAAQSPTALPTPEHRVLPDLVGMQRAAAESKLDEAGILFLVEPVKGKDDDRVIRQYPAAGVPVSQAKHVMLSVRCRPRPCPQPPEGSQMYDPCACLWR